MILSKENFFIICHDKSDSEKISSSKITCIMEDSKGFIWIGTHSGGIDKFDRIKKTFQNYSTGNGLPNDVVFGIQEDKKGNLWISTMKGLAKFDPVKEKFRVYDKTDGILHNQFNWHASYKNKLGIMYFGGLDGFISFNPDSIYSNNYVPDVAFKSFKVFDKEANLPRALPTTKEIILNYNQNFFSIEFAVLDFTNPDKYNFEYKLEGLDPGWVNAGNRTTAFYTDIKSGKYKFLC